MNQTWENSKTPSSGPDFGPFGKNFAQLFFSKIWLRQSLDIMVSYYHVQYQEKLMIQSWENLVMDGRMDRRIDRQMGTDTGMDTGTNSRMREWFHRCCLTNVERPKYKLLSVVKKLVELEDVY